MTIAITVFYFPTKLKITTKKFNKKKMNCFSAVEFFIEFQGIFAIPKMQIAADCDRTTVFPVVPAVLQK